MFHRSVGKEWRDAALAIGCCFAATANAWAEDSFQGSKAGDERTVQRVRLCWCPAGSFRMGSPPDEAHRRPDEGPVQVTLSHGFWMSKFEVTEGEWKRISGALPGNIGEGAGDDFALHSVNYIEAQAYCQKLTEQARAAGELSDKWEFRLPTEAEWEYACRAGSKTATSFGDQMSRRQANFAGKVYFQGETSPFDDEGPELNRSTKVGSYPANAWGLCDMHGNMFEWCLDWYHATLPGGTDPDLSSEQGERNRDGTYSRVRRGGSFNESGMFCRSALRLRYEPERRSDHIGFRIVAAPRTR